MGAVVSNTTCDLMLPSHKSAKAKLMTITE